MGLPNTFLGIDSRPVPMPESTVRRLDETTPVPFDPLTGSVPLDTLAARLEVAVTASAGTQLALSDLLNIAKGLGSALNEVRDTNDELMRELAAVGEALTVHARERVMLEARVEWLGGALMRARDEAAREQARLIAEHDHFIAMLMADHDRELEEARRSAAEQEVRELPRSEPPEFPRSQPPELPRAEASGEIPRPPVRELPRPAIPRLPRRQS